MSRFDLSDAEWAIIAPLLPGGDGRRRPGRPTRDDRRVLNGIFFVLRTGIPWRDLPERYGPYTTVYNRFNRHPRPPACGRRQKGGDHAIGRSRGGLSSKLNALVDEHGLPRRIALTAGQAHDNRAVPVLLANLPAGAEVVADRSYDANATPILIEAAGANAHIPTPLRRRLQRSVDPALYRRRNLVEMV